MTDWSAARTHAGDPADVFAALDLLELIHRPAWHADALCREHPELSWFPVRGEPTAPAKAIGARCLVRDECAAYALSEPTIAGVWAGTTARERRRLRLGRVAA